MRGWVLTATVAIASAGVALGLLARPRSPPPAPLASPACPPEAPLPALAPATAGLVLVAPGAAGVRLDGQPLAPASRQAAGRHRLEAEGGVRLELAVAPFAPARVELVPDGAALVPLLLGVGCASCEPPPAAELELTPAPGEPDLDESARALGRGAWRQALEVLRRVPPHRRGEPRVQLQLAALWAEAGRPSRAPRLAAALARLEPRRREEEVLERAWQLERWNLATERLSRLLNDFAVEAERLVSAASVRTERLSAAFGAATERGDLAEGQASLAAEEATLEALRLDLLALRPEDCAWRARVGRAHLGPLPP
jgi:hypothetical protein